MKEQLTKELAVALNRVSAENASNTPDFILAEFLVACLDAWNKAMQQRTDWYEPTFAKHDAAADL